MVAPRSSRVSLPNGGPRAGKVASILGHDSASNAARTLDNLVLKGLAETYDDAAMRRRWLLTDAGRAVAEAIGGEDG